MQETQLLSLGQENPLEEEMAMHSNMLAWKIPWTDEPGGVQSMGSRELDMSEYAHTRNVARKRGLAVNTAGC